MGIENLRSEIWYLSYLLKYAYHHIKIVIRKYIY